jgi:hypothetical protein
LAKAKFDGDLATALRGVAVANQVLITMSKLTGAIDEGVRLNVTLAPEVSIGLLQCLMPFPQAAEAVRLFLSDMVGRQPLLIDGRAS